ncbi:MAG: thiamine pyrophosphate-dependent dehydrogenase E1 component subunit alpha [Actinobacteria bacterium]|nr:thiamine pyrophosphate-dependent dehydrogenase E1 component subunit alpha [Actinomycetota bacterium]
MKNLKKGSKQEVEAHILVELYKKIILARLFEERVYKLIIEGIILGSVHLSLGEEASAAGTISVLSKQDYIMPTHRGHAQVLSRGAEPKIVMAELAGKETGYSKGICGSIHIFDRANNNLGSNGIVGGQFPIAVGVGLAIRYKKLNSIVACFFGDGATNQGWFYELLNLSSLWGLPVVLVCINNLYGMGMPYGRTSPISVHEKAEAFRIKSVIADGNDVEDVYLKTKEIVDYSRNEKKPVLIECLTYRYSGHSAHDNRPYRPAGEIAFWKTRDPVKITYDSLIKAGFSAGELEKIRTEAALKVDEAEKFAKESRFAEFKESMQL